MVYSIKSGIIRPHLKEKYPYSYFVSHWQKMQNVIPTNERLNLFCNSIKLSDVCQSVTTMPFLLAAAVAINEDNQFSLKNFLLGFLE